MWYEKITDLEQLIEARNQTSSATYDKLLEEKCKAIDKAVDAGLCSESSGKGRKEKIQKELVRSTKWFNATSISGRLETECPILLRDKSGNPIISAETEKPITALELVQNTIEDPWLLTEEMIQFLSKDMDVPAEVLVKIKEAASKDDAEVIDLTHEAEASEPLLEAPATEGSTTLVLENKLGCNLAVLAFKKGNKIHIRIMNNYRDSYELPNTFRVRSSDKRYEDTYEEVCEEMIDYPLEITV